MLFTKVWKKEVPQFLEELKSFYGGEIQHPKIHESSHTFLSVENSHFVHARYLGKYEEVKLFIDIANSPVSGVRLSNAAGGYEYIRIFLYIESGYNIFVRREDLFDRIQKKLNLLYEFQTGNLEFDKKYLIEAPTTRDQSLIRNRRFQGMIKKIEPFDTFRVFPNVIAFSQGITNKSTVAHVNPIIYKMSKLLEDF